MEERNGTKTVSTGSLEYTLDLTNDLTQLEIRDEYTNCRKIIELKDVDFEKELKGYYHFKRESKILFAKNQTYNVWDETRFIPKGEPGLVLDLAPSYSIKFEPGITIRKRKKNWIIYEITEEYHDEYYTKGKSTYLITHPFWSESYIDNIIADTDGQYVKRDIYKLIRDAMFLE